MKEVKAKELVIRHLIKNKKHDIAIPEVVIGKNNSVRSDIFALNGDISIYEIKTKNDTLVRLENQIKFYQQYANRVYVVVDKKFLDKLNVDSTIGIYELTNRGINLIREATFNNLPVENYFDYWWTLEFKEILRGVPGFSKITNYLDGQQALKNILSDEEIKKLTIFRLKERYQGESDDIKECIYKQSEIKFIKRKVNNNLKITPLKDIPFGVLKTISLQ